MNKCKGNSRITPGSVIPIERIENRILLIRGHKVMLDSDLADLYGVTTGNLNKAVTRNISRFPGDFMFQLSKDELDNLIFQSGISSWGGKRKPPRTFTEQGIAMLSGVLRSERAVQVNIMIMRAFVNMRQMIASNESLRAKLDYLEKKYDGQFKLVFKVLHALSCDKTKTKEKREIGFTSERDKDEH